jgi:hypothetical protein
MNEAICISARAKKKGRSLIPSVDERDMQAGMLFPHFLSFCSHSSKVHFPLSKYLWDGAHQLHESPSCMRKTHIETQYKVKKIHIFILVLVWESS